MLNEINQEIIALEFQFADATSRINLKVLQTPEKEGELKTPQDVIKRSLQSIDESIELNQKLIALLQEREEILKGLIPTTEQEPPKEVL